MPFVHFGMDDFLTGQTIGVGHLERRDVSYYNLNSFHILCKDTLFPGKMQIKA